MLTEAKRLIDEGIVTEEEMELRLLSQLQVSPKEAVLSEALLSRLTTNAHYQRAK